MRQMGRPDRVVCGRNDTPRGWSLSSAVAHSSHAPRWWRRPRVAPPTVQLDARNACWLDVAVSGLTPPWAYAARRGTGRSAQKRHR
jgi:hypothetical protein